MTNGHFVLLRERGVIAVTGEDARHFLDNLVTNDLDQLDRQEAIHAGLLTPQGKILFAFFIVRRPDGYLLETSQQQVGDLVKRLTLYRLRAKVAISDVSANYGVAAAWGGPAPIVAEAVTFADPRAAALGYRLLMAPEAAAKLGGCDDELAAYEQLRISLGVPEAGRDYPLGDTFPHEADFDIQAGVSFTKGCFVGQEVVARMQHKTVVRKRVVRIIGAAPLTSGKDVMVGEAVIGKVGSTAGTEALALLRLDRVAEAVTKGLPVTADSVAITVSDDALARFTTAKSERSAT